MRTDWLLNDDGVLDGGSDWFSRIWAQSEMEELTVGDSIEHFRRAKHGYEWRERARKEKTKIKGCEFPRRLCDPRRCAHSDCVASWS